MRVCCGLVLAGLGLVFVACGASNPPPPLPAAATPDVATPVILPESPTRVVVPTRSTSPGTLTPVALTLWVPEEFATGAERGGDILETHIADFHAAHPNTRLNYVLKAPYGKGGIIDWLRQLQELMPERLPDAAIVDSRELDELEKLGLLHSLQRDLPSGALWDLFPPAQEIARRNGQWNNQPLTLETEHLVYDASRVASPPLSWQQVITDSIPFSFAGDSTETFLFHYLENGGSLDPSAHPALDAGVMHSILDYYQRARASADLSENTAVMKSAREIIPLFVTGQTTMAQVRARDFLLERTRLPNARAAQIPTRHGRPSALVSSWSFVIFTTDETKRIAVVEYLAWLIDPAHMGEWSAAARQVPASRSAFAQAIDSSEYADVLWSLLEAAIVAPGFAEQKVYADAWHNAVEAVFNGLLTPNDAAFRAMQAITQ